MANGVERQVGRDELRAAFRLLESQAPRETLRMVTAYGQYISAVRDDLGLHGYNPGTLEGEDEDDEGEGTLEAILIEEARARTRAVGPPEVDRAYEASSASSDLVAPDDRPALLRELAEEKSAKEDLVRQHSQLRAEFEEASKRLEEAEARRVELEGALKHASETRAKTPATIGAKGDWGVLAALARSEVADLPPGGCRRAIEQAASHMSVEPRLAVVECREALEVLAADEYLRVFRTEAPAGSRGHADLMMSLRGQPGVDEGFWHLRKTLYSQLSDVVHGRKVANQRSGSVMLLATAMVLEQIVSGAKGRGTK